MSTIMLNDNHTYEISKRVFDIFASVIVIVLLFPLMLAIALMIWLDSSGPIFYKGVRTGYLGLPFYIYKFRTMVENADAMGGLSAAKDDKRVTRFGRFLRRSKINEFPQLLNVLQGEMSIVGPRPEHPEHTALYDESEQIILTVRPGLTDYASIRYFQISDILGNDDPDRIYAEEIRPIKNQLRIKYVKERGWWVDLTIVFQTVLKFLGF